MTAKEYLLQIRRLDRRINNKLAEMEQLYALAMNVSAATDREPLQASGVSDKVGNAVANIIDLQKEINALVDEFVDTRQQIIAQIEQLEKIKPLYYAILHSVYVLKKKLYDVAQEEGYTVQYIREQHIEALALFETTYANQLNPTE